MFVEISGEKREYPQGITLREITEEFQPQKEHDIVLALQDGKLRELYHELDKDCRLEFVTTGEKAGMDAYRRSCVLLLLKAVYDASGEERPEKVFIDYSLSKGYYGEITGGPEVDEAFLRRVEDRMREVVEKNIPIEKCSVHTDLAVEHFARHGMYDKARLFRYRRSSRVNIYRLSEFEDYYYGYMVPSAGYLKYFQLHPYENGFVLQLPVVDAPETVPPFRPQFKLFQTMQKASAWGKMLDVQTVGALNDKIVSGGLNQLILTEEALMEKQLAELADQIMEDRSRKFVMVAGPSSSGKTTFSHRLSTQLLAHGCRPHPIAVDNYFLNREDSPRDEFGNYNYEDLECLDLEQFNQDMLDLLDGRRVEMPTYNFKTGLREYRGNFLQLGENDILVIEGIHCLNDRLSHALPKESKFKIYISALTQLNIDEHNRIPTTDGRLIRRMVRDARTRGNTAAETIRMWSSVRRGEEKNIFPFQEEADAMFNSALVYELAVLKQYAEPLLFSVGPEEPEYLEAKRLLKFFDYFLGISSEEVPRNSLVREFIGGSCFDV